MAQISRRDAGRALLAGCAGLLIPGHSSLPRERMASRRIIDVHTHLGQFGNSNQSADGERLSTILRLAGITQAIASSVEACYGGIRLGNRFTFSEVSKQEMLSMALVVHPYHRRDSIDLLNELADHPKVVAVKLHPHLGGYHVLAVEVRRLIEKEIAPRHLTVLSHVANDAPYAQATDFLRLAKSFPELRFVAAHLGVGVLGDGRRILDAWEEHKPRNVWLDAATLRTFSTGILEEILGVVGPERICFGTDAPLYWPPAFIATLETLNLAPETRERIAWKNAVEAFPRLSLC